MQKIRVIDSHTAGEPTRVVIAGFPELQGQTIAEQRDFFRQNYDHLRNAIVNEPRGHSAIVGALPGKPIDKTCDAAVIFFNNVGFLNMCGHGTIGLVETLKYLEKIETGTVRIETPVGIVEAKIDEEDSITITNVPSYRLAKNVEVEVENYGIVRGDIAWGGNWFFLIEEHPFEINLQNLQQLTAFTTEVRNALSKQQITGKDGAEIDHIEVFSKTPTANSRNFVLCPGIEYDRSPCGTGTSAKLACLYEDGKISEGEIWRQESIIGSSFEGKVTIVDGKIIPNIRGKAFITADITLILDENDPFKYGIY